jgi:hypothetical protein
MKNRASPTYDFSPGDVETIVSFIKNSADSDEKRLYESEVLGTRRPSSNPAQPVAREASYSQLLEHDGTSDPVYGFLIGGASYPNFTPVRQERATRDVDWINPTIYRDRDRVTVITSLQRFPHLTATATAYRFLGNPGYGDTIARTLFTWAGQAPPQTDAALLRLYRAPGSGAYTTTIPGSIEVLPAWAPLDTGVRVYPMLQMYNLLLGTPAWTPTLNTLFLYLMFHHGRVLGETAKAAVIDDSSRVLPGDSKPIGVDANPLGRTDNNKALQLSAALLTVARMFPEFKAIRDAGGSDAQIGWKSSAKRLLKVAIPRNYRGRYHNYANPDSVFWKFDGFHKEQSAGYAQNMVETFVNQLKLSQINGGVNDPFLKDDPELRQLLSGEYVVPDASGKADPAGAIPVAQRVEALYQIMNPDGTAPSVGDTPRPSLTSMLLEADLVLKNDPYARNRDYRWPTKYPNLEEIFSLWKKDIRSVAQAKTNGEIPIYPRHGRDVGVPFTVGPDNRPNSPRKYSSWLPGAGYYMFRSDDHTRDDVQLTFDVGMMGLPNYNQNSSTMAHTQYDLLNLELYGYRRPLIEDPGLHTYGNSRERNWVLTTPAHNSFTVDNYSHARMDGYLGVIGPTEDRKGVAVTGFHYGYQKLDIDGDHPNGAGPALARTVWYDKDDTFLVIDWGHQTTERNHKYRISFTLPTPPTLESQQDSSRAAPVLLIDRADAGKGVFTNAENGNVFIQPLQPRSNPSPQKVIFTTGRQSATNGTVDGPLVTSANFSGDASPAARLVVQQTGSSSNFVTMIHTYAEQKTGAELAQSATARIISQSQRSVIVRVTRDGLARDLTFTNPFAIGLAPPLTRHAIPTRPTTVPSRIDNPNTGGYPSLIESNEGPAPRDLNDNRFIIGAGDGVEVPIEPVPTARLAIHSSAVFSAAPIDGIDVHDFVDDDTTWLLS